MFSFASFLPWLVAVYHDCGGEEPVSSARKESNRVWNLKNGKAYLIEWEDSYGCSSRWEDIATEREPQALLCRSLGWVMRQSKRFIVLIPHLAKNDDLEAHQGCGDMVIPLAAIVRVERLPVSD